MKLVTYLYNGNEYPGALVNNDAFVVPLPYADMNELIDNVPCEKLCTLLDEVKGEAIPISRVKLLSPIPRPRQDLICLGLNYLDHAEETARKDGNSTDVKAVATYFEKRVRKASGPDDDIPSYVGFVKELDYEAELGVIISKNAFNVTKENARNCIFGYTIINDVSARRIQAEHGGQWFFGKSLDGFCPIGPCILTADSVEYPLKADITCYVNGELRQKSNTSLLIHKVDEIISEISQGIELLPGDIISTGTPAGVGMGYDPPKFLKPGDEVVCIIDGIGTLRNKVK